MEGAGNRGQDGVAETEATVVICRRNGRERVGLVVQRVLDIADAEVLPAEASHHGRLALVSKRLATVQPGFGMLEVAA